MAMKLKRAVLWGVGILAVVTVGLYAEWVREMTGYDPFMLVGCAGEGSTVRAWTCRQVISHVAWTPDQVAQLNKQAGIEFAAQIGNEAVARQMVSLFVKRGVDINAGDWHFVGKGRTALHTFVAEGNAQRVKLLLDFGARANVKDVDGVTALDLAKEEQQKHPADQSRAEIVRLLEATQERQDAAIKWGDMQHSKGS